MAPTHPSPRYARKRVRGGPPNSTNTSIANDPNAAKIDVCGCPITLSASAKTAGMTIAARAALFNAARSATAGDDTSPPDPWTKGAEDAEQPRYRRSGTAG